jgi:acetyl esterase/lipase
VTADVVSASQRLESTHQFSLGERTACRVRRTFLLQAQNDHVDPVKHSLTYYAALQKAGVPVEMHLYAQGDHAFGLRPTKLPVGRWPALVEEWLHTIGMLR